jgi:3-mercaptopyruvate sulfurtransferase SseA
MSDVLISAADLDSFMKSTSTVFLDTRSPEAFSAGHIPGAVNVHEIFTYLATSTSEGIDELKARFIDVFAKAGLSGKEVAVVYEQSMTSGFGQSCRGYFLLALLGYQNIKVLHGGFDAWLREGLPIARETTVFLYCFKGARAANTFVALKHAGVEDVRMYFGSWNEWSRDPSYPIEEGHPAEQLRTELQKEVRSVESASV